MNLASANQVIQGHDVPDLSPQELARIRIAYDANLIGSDWYVPGVGVISPFELRAALRFGDPDFLNVHPSEYGG